MNPVTNAVSPIFPSFELQKSYGWRRETNSPTRAKIYSQEITTAKQRTTKTEIPKSLTRKMKQRKYNTIIECMCLSPDQNFTLNILMSLQTGNEKDDKGYQTLYYYSKMVK